jgi:lysophospholipase L1-like esterase
MAPFRRVLAVAIAAAATWAAGAVPAASASSVSSSPASSSSAASAVAGDSYVAMGDSYASGEGIGTSTRAPVLGCLQSTQDYPHQVAARLGLRLTDMSCSGAVTANIDTTPQKTGSGTAPLQDSALTASTDLVTITIGGNDLGFGSIVQYCAADSPNGPLALHPQSNCKQMYDPNGDDSLQHKLTAKVTPAIARVLVDIKLKSPHAKILILDYPAISPDKADAPDPATYPSSCFLSPLKKNSFPFTAVDTMYLEELEVHLGQAVQAAAVAADVDFVDVFPQSLPHSACAGTATPWMNGLTLDQAQLKLVAGSLHPNLAGATAMADTVTVAADKALTVSSPPAVPITSKKAGSAATIIVVVVVAVVLLILALAVLLRRRRSTSNLH